MTSYFFWTLCQWVKTVQWAARKASNNGSHLFKAKATKKKKMTHFVIDVHQFFAAIWKGRSILTLVAIKGKLDWFFRASFNFRQALPTRSGCFTVIWPCHTLSSLSMNDRHPLLVKIFPKPGCDHQNIFQISFFEQQQQWVLLSKSSAARTSTLSSFGQTALQFYEPQTVWSIIERTLNERT